MPYDVKCRTCSNETRAANIVDLFNDHTNPNGRFICRKCLGTDTFIYRESELQEGPSEVWKRWIKGAIRINSDIPTYFPYIFLTADSEDGPISGFHFHYYKDTRSQPGGRLKHGHGPGGPPVLETENLFTVLHHLVSQGIVSKEKIREFTENL